MWGGDRGPGAVDTRWFVLGMLGYTSNMYGFAIGARFGKTLDNHLYLGGSLVYGFGESGSTTTLAGPNGASVTVNTNGPSSFYLGPEVGYDFDVRPVVLRPYIGLGPAFVASTTRLVVWPGFTVSYEIPHSIAFVGGDLRFVSVLGGGSLGFFGFGGVHF
jgi:hypothetical protein